jgi:hypothetical protein
METVWVQDSILQVTKAVASRAAGLLIRDPAVDPRCPDSSDLDFVVLADIAEMRSERLSLVTAGAGPVLADLTWLPWAWVVNPEEAATRGWVPHRLLSSNVVWDEGREIATLCDAIAQHMARPEIQSRRVSVFLDTGFQAVREIGITWDFPALGMFWLHMAYAACLAALADGLHMLCPNIFTRPFDHLDRVELNGHPGLRLRWIEALRLDDELEPLVERLLRCHALMSSRFPEPCWPASIREGVRFEYRYWVSHQELAWRIRTARELALRGDCAAAVFHLRFCAYAVARLPVVHERALEGISGSFLRPEKAMLPDLKRLAPEIIDDLSLMLAGPGVLLASNVKISIDNLLDFRGNVCASLVAQGIPIAPLKTWAPYQAVTP